MKFKQKIAYMAIGSLFTLAGYFLSTLTTGGITPQTATAQTEKGDPIADVIQCRELQIINDAGHKVVILGGVFDAGYLRIYNKEKKAVASFSSTVDGDGELFIRNKNEKTAIEIGTNSGQGGLLAVYNNAGKEVALLVSAGQGGGLILNDKVGNKTVGLGVSKRTDESLLEMFDNKLNQVVRIGADENGGALHIKNKDDKSVVLIGTDKHGNGVINTFTGSWKTY